MEPKAWQAELFRPRYNIEPGQHARRLLDMLRTHATSVVFVVEDFQTAMLKAADHHSYIVTIVSCQERATIGQSIWREQDYGVAV